jgi:hypothetical protein
MLLIPLALASMSASAPLNRSALEKSIVTARHNQVRARFTARQRESVKHLSKLVTWARVRRTGNPHAFRRLTATNARVVLRKLRAARRLLKHPLNSKQKAALVLVREVGFRQKGLSVKSSGRIGNYTAKQLGEIRSLLTQNFTPNEVALLERGNFAGRKNFLTRKRTRFVALNARDLGRALAQGYSTPIQFMPSHDANGNSHFQTTFHVQGASVDQVVQAIHDAKPSEIAPVMNFTPPVTSPDGNTVSAFGGLPFVPSAIGSTVSKTGTPDGADVSATGPVVSGHSHISVEDDGAEGVKVTEDGDFGNTVTNVAHAALFDLGGAVSDHLNAKDDQDPGAETDDTDQDVVPDYDTGVGSIDQDSGDSTNDGFADDSESADDSADTGDSDGGGDDGGGDE